MGPAIRPNEWDRLLFNTKGIVITQYLILSLVLRIVDGCSKLRSIVKQRSREQYSMLCHLPAEVRSDHRMLLVLLLSKQSSDELGCAWQTSSRRGCLLALSYLMSSEEMIRPSSAGVD